MLKCVRIMIPGLLLALNMTSACAAPPPERCTIAWSHYTGWEPIQYMKDSGILAKWGKRYGVDLAITSPMDYVESINQYTAKKVCAVAVTNMDALTIPALGGVDTTFIVIGDYSNGNDGILAKGAAPLTLKDLNGRDVKLVEYTVSHYLLARAFQTGVSDNVKKAIVGAWFEVTGIMAERNSQRQRDAIAQMAKSAGGSGADFAAQLKTTSLFFNASDAVKFTKDAQLKQTMNFVRRFVFEMGLLKNAKSPDVVGIQFPDATVLGDAKHIRLRFDTKYMEMAAAGTLI